MPARLVAIAVLTLLLAGCTGLDVSFRNIDWPDAGYPSRAITATIVRPDGEGPHPAVVLLHTCDGLKPPLTREWPEYFASQGYVALAVDSFGSRGLGPCPNGLHTGSRLPAVDTWREMTRDAYGALDYLAQLPFVHRDRVAVVGFALGDEAVDYFLLQHPRRPLDFAAAVTVYRREDEAARPSEPRLPALQLFGDIDAARTPQSRELLRAFLARQLK
jgi:dienelactone hydrolase